MRNPVRRGAILLGGGLILVFLWLFRLGFVPINRTAFPIHPTAYRSWSEVFKNDGQNIVKMTVVPWRTGEIAVRSRAQFLDHGAEHVQALEGGKRSVPVWVYFLKHPVFGEMLIDAGFDKSFSKQKHGNYNLLGRIFTTVSGIREIQRDGEALDDRLTGQGADPRRVFFTHLHFDHVAGLPALPAGVLLAAGKEETDFIARASAGQYFKGRVLQEIDIEQGIAMPPFEKALDLLGDGSFWAVKTGGHTPGHLSYLVMATDGPVLITGDACFYYQALALGVGPFAQYPRDKASARRSIGEIREFVRLYPRVRVYVGHDDLENQHFTREGAP